MAVAAITNPATVAISPSSFTQMVSFQRLLSSQRMKIGAALHYQALGIVAGWRFVNRELTGNRFQHIQRRNQPCTTPNSLVTITKLPRADAAHNRLMGSGFRHHYRRGRLAAIAAQRRATLPAPPATLSPENDTDNFVARPDIPGTGYAEKSNC